MVGYCLKRSSCHFGALVLPGAEFLILFGQSEQFGKLVKIRAPGIGFFFCVMQRTPCRLEFTVFDPADIT